MLDLNADVPKYKVSITDSAINYIANKVEMAGVTRS
jgi:hypothetical protein